MLVQSEHSLFLASWEIDSKNPRRVLDKARDLSKIMKERPEAFPRSVCGPYSFKEGGKGFQVFEANHVKLDNLLNFWFPEIVLTFKPISETRLWEMNGPLSQAAKNLQNNQAINVR